jgi:hypothetical protein
MIFFNKYDVILFRIQGIKDKQKQNNLYNSVLPMGGARFGQILANNFNAINILSNMGFM